jgi:hypothetical protein
MFRQLLRGGRRAFQRMVVGVLVTGVLLLGYDVALVWFVTRNAPTTLSWLLIAPSVGVAALLSAALIAPWMLGPLLAMGRVLRYLTRLPAALAADPHLSTRELARRLECSEEEALALRQVLATVLASTRVGATPPPLAA